MNGVIDALILLLTLYGWILLAVVLMSWINPDPYNPVVRFLRQITDPVLLPFRKLLMPLTMRLRIDFSPIIAFLLIGLLQRVLTRLKYGGFSPAGIGWAVLDGLIVFASTIAIFLFIFLVARIFVDVTNADRWNPIVRFITTVTDPIVYGFRSARVRGSKFNFAPVAGALVMLVAYLLLTSLRTMLP